MPETVVQRLAVPLVIQTKVPGMSAAELSTEDTLEKAQRALDEAAPQIRDFLLHLKTEVFEETGADTLTLSCGLSVTVGVDFGVELSGTGQISVDLTWNKPA
ncbi:MAG TPA: hypothetical protein VL117_06600 [Thermoleophilia bacterium]|nr:hypothetical protein [Thermoleophilia bacterium]